MSKIYTSEQVSRGHVDKICDQIADAIVTDCLQHDKNSRVAVECLIKNNTVIVRSKEVKQPAAARYGWQPFTRANLVNAAGLPASTFRTAAW